MKKGFTLIEVMFAIFILTVSAFGAFALIQSTLTSASLNKQKLTAYYLAQEGVEVIRNIRDNNWLRQRSDPDISWTEGIKEAKFYMRIPACNFYGDINFDGVVSREDLALDAFGSVYNQAVETEAGERADFNEDGFVDSTDFGFFGGYFPEDPYDKLPVSVPLICEDSSKFRREITISSYGDNMKITSKVTWSRSGTAHEVIVVSRLTNWK